jgi:hypothetical protein
MALSHPISVGLLSKISSFLQEVFMNPNDQNINKKHKNIVPSLGGEPLRKNSGEEFVSELRAYKKGFCCFGFLITLM